MKPDRGRKKEKIVIEQIVVMWEEIDCMKNAM
jgi:hypothetical protein